MALGAFLPALIKPIYYYLAIQVYLEGFLDVPDDKVNSFKGTVRLMFQPVKDTDVFYLNSDGLEIQSYRIYTPENVLVSSNMVPLEENVLEFKTKMMLLENQFYLVEINYRGNMREDASEGLYISRSKDKKQISAATKFEPHYARRMVPCVDQPDAKAVWKVTVIHPKNTRAASNAERIKLIERKGWALTKFADSPKMSPYLLAIFVSDFNHVSARTQSGIKVRMFAPNGTLTAYKNVFDYSVDRLDFYSKFFDSDPGIKKLDQVVVELGSAGMENWGLVSYHDRALEGENRLHTVAHELVHQWIGNQITPVWWDDLWITEGLATFIAEHLPYMGRVFQLYQGMQTLLEYEQATDPKRGLILPLKTKIELDELKRGKSAVMNYNVYNRGAMFAGMIHALLGTDSFRKAVQTLINRHRYETITQQDWVDALAEQVDPVDKPEDFNRFARTWIEQAGHPILNVKTVEGGIMIEQERNFNAERIHPKYRDNAPFDFKYDVPVFYTTNSNEGDLVWLYYNKPSIFIPVAEADVISIDPFGEGMYKVHYDEAWYKRWARICPEKKCHNDVFFKPCEEFLRVQGSYSLEIRQLVLETCLNLDQGFILRHPSIARVAAAA